MNDVNREFNLKVEFLPDNFPKKSIKKEMEEVKLQDEKDQLEISKENLFPEEGSEEGFDWTLEE